ncbi:hypothetical protein BJV74DRAFT_867110 [Russula compacta]|nr:hypothetical protein BJV74DRAFT_867110 [Russula compacta]
MERGGQKTGYGPEVSEMFSRRLGTALERVQAMRYPLNGHRKDIVDAEGARGREKELAKGIQEGEIDEEDALGGDF